MDIKELKYFTTIVECKNITQAAKVLHISQPPLSQAIKQLETELNVKLFDRGARSITLTDAGEILYERSKKIFLYMEDTKRELKNVIEGYSGCIKLGIISSLSSERIALVCKSFNEKYPDVTFNCVEKNTYDLLKAIDSNDIEFAVLRTPIEGG